MPAGGDAASYWFKEDCLFIANNGEILQIHGWPKPKALSRRPPHQWISDDPVFRLVVPYRRKKQRTADPNQLELPMAVGRSYPARRPPMTKKRAFERFRFTLPKRLASGIEAFRSHQWRLITMTWHFNELALDLIDSNPVLAFALANDLEFARLSRLKAKRTYLKKILQRKQRDILKALKFPDTKAMMHLTRKICVQSVNPENIKAMRTALHEGTFDWGVAHLERLNSGALAIASHRELQGSYAPKLLHEVSRVRKEDYFPFTMHHLAEVLQMSAQVRPRENLPQFSTIRQVERLHDELIHDFIRTPSKRLKCCRFSDPPIPGTETIIPLRTVTELREESEEQKNCVAGYVNRVMTGATYVYRVLSPERATLSIVRYPNGSWGIGELKARRNTEISAETRRTVQRWLAAHNVSA